MSNEHERILQKKIISYVFNIRNIQFFFFFFFLSVFIVTFKKFYHHTFVKTQVSIVYRKKCRKRTRQVIVDTLCTVLMQCSQCYTSCSSSIVERFVNIISLMSIRWSHTWAHINYYY